jgi:uncharacterized UPF0160 family protein
MTDDLVKRLRQFERWDPDQKEAADRIEELNRAVLDLAQYVSSADLGFYIDPETKKVLSELGEKTDD